MNQQLLNQVKEINQLHRSYLDKSRNLSQEQFNKKPGPDQWSIAQTLYHIWFASDFTHKFMEKRIQEKKVTTRTTLKTAYRNVLLHLFLALPIKFKAPKAVSVIPDEITFDELENSFKQIHANFESFLQRFPAELEDKEIFKHPRIGYINAGQTFSFIKAHALHHKPQIENLLKTV
jgi:uncharacterized damage-inducible protein DinB